MFNRYFCFQFLVIYNFNIMFSVAIINFGNLRNNRLLMLVEIAFLVSFYTKINFKWQIHQYGINHSLKMIKLPFLHGVVTTL